MSRIKGASILSSISVIRDIVGPQQFQALLGRCPTETQQVLRRTLMAVELVPVDVWSPFLDAVYEVVAGRDEAKLRRLLRAICKRDFTGPYRAYIQSTRDEELLGKLPAIYSAYFDSGSLNAGLPEKKGNTTHATVVLKDLESSSRIFVLVLQAYLEQLLIMVGARNPQVGRAREMRLGGRLSCEYLLTFE